MTIHLHVLKGCSPAPLANYLKALGILRLVGEQADKQARGWWDGEHFCLLTKLSKEELEAFFLEKIRADAIAVAVEQRMRLLQGERPGTCSA